MTDNQLATLSTLIWLVLTTILFVELANWSAGGSWTIVPGLVRGVRGWVVRGQEPDLPAFAIPSGGISRHVMAGVVSTSEGPNSRDAGLFAAATSAARTPAEPTWYDLDPGAEIEELDDLDS